MDFAFASAFVGEPSPVTSAPVSFSTVRPKSRTSAARTASGPVFARVVSGRPWQVSVAAARPVRAADSSVASGSCLAYASG